MIGTAQNVYAASNRRHTRSGEGGNTSLSASYIARLVGNGLSWAMPLFLLFAAIRLALRHRRGERGLDRRECLLWLFVFYLVMLFSLTIFSRTPLQISSGLAERLNIVNLTPFHETYKLLRHGAVALFWYNVAGNIAWFVPMGALWPALLRGQWKGIKTFFFCLGISFFIETLQLVFAVGVPDVDDLILNVLGGIIGYFAYFILKKTLNSNK